MTTIRDVIERAGRKAGMGYTLNGDEFTAALDAFNDMVAAWKLDGIDIWGDDALNGDLPDVDVDHPTYAESDTFPMPNAFIEGATYLLAARIAVEYQYPVNFDADGFLRKVQAHYTKIPVATFPSMLTYRDPYR